MLQLNCSLKGILTSTQCFLTCMQNGMIYNGYILCPNNGSLWLNLKNYYKDEHMIHVTKCM